MAGCITGFLVFMGGMAFVCFGVILECLFGSAKTVIDVRLPKDDEND